MDATNRNTALASAMAEELARCGVRHATLSPGSRSTPLALALWREEAIDVSVIVDERSAGFFALGAAYATGVPTAVLTTSGTAAANLHPAVCEADESGLAMMVLTADRPPELRGIGAGQTIDQLKLYGDAVRWFCELGTHDADDSGLLHFRSAACRAFAAAAGDPRPGPVHLNIAWRDPLGPEPRPQDVTASSELALNGRDGGRPLTAVPAPPREPAEPLIEAMAEQIAAHPRGLIIAGRMPWINPAARPAVAAAIASLASAAGYPILAEPTSGLRMGPHDRGGVISAYDAIARAKPPTLEPELAIRFGELPTSKPLRLWLATLEETPQIVVDAGYGWNEPTRHASAMVRAEPAALARAISKRLDPGAFDGAWSASWRAAELAVREALADELTRTGEPTEPGLHAALGRAYRDGELVYTASSMPIRDQEAILAPTDADVTFLANRGANGIDGFISSGIGAAHATGRPTVIVTGDLGLLHDVGALQLLREEPVPIRIVIVNNGGGGIFEFLPQARQLDADEFEALLATPRGIDVAGLARAFGLPHRLLDDLDDLPEALAGGTCLIEIRADRRTNVHLHQRLAGAAAEALAKALA